MRQTATQLHAIAARRNLPLDPQGFLVDPALWNRGMARFIAKLDGTWPLTPEHWSVIYYLREHHLSYGALPPTSQICRTHGLDRHAVQRLFGSCREAWRIAGLPHPGDEALAYMV
ncbi:TusE/DsrC/DsvC family sulfur relay protein [Thiorhodococcus mannitoliphagus]|uniref:Sulfurtransferase n=1 Tax=Thiorhodococcus mannitoliphagus TaxID=329406 RepID=A0A6P1DVE5_9GAMM|nr:TusE/DsrC/DsvC family sulfur relay protein [Thiorhodococcus mannitoliphagus]NEX22088.1 TusE/DsrC/DsvC family sulfur relay protein [Thiorhodococcus mannitoliphagus]